jgi:hypothetical protein
MGVVKYGDYAVMLQVGRSRRDSLAAGAQVINGGPRTYLSFPE